MDDLFDTVVISTCCMDPGDKGNVEAVNEEDDLGWGVWFLIFLVLMGGIYLFINYV